MKNNYLQTGACKQCGAPIFTAKPGVVGGSLIVFTGDPDPDVYFSCTCFSSHQKERKPESKLTTFEAEAEKVLVTG